MKPGILLLLTISLLFLEGCSIIGYSSGSSKYKIETHSAEQLETLENNCKIRIKLKDEEMIESQNWSAAGDTLFIISDIEDKENLKTISSFPSFQFSANEVIYQIPISDIVELQVIRGDKRWEGFFSGALVDLVIFGLIVPKLSDGKDYDVFDK